MRRALSVLIAMFLFCSLGVAADQVNPAAPSGFFGIYVGGAKAGYSAWNIDLKEVGKDKYYRFSITEERVSGDKKEQSSYTGTLDIDLSARTLDCTETRAGRTSTIKAKRTGTSIAVTVQFKGSAAMPERKVAVSPDCTWSCFAPLAFAWRKSDSSKPATINWIVESGCIAISHKLTPKSSKAEVHGEEKDVVEWTDDSKCISLITDSEGNLISYFEKNKAGLETKYVAEPEETAKAGIADAKKPEADPNKDKQDKPKANVRKKIKDKVIGDKDGLFSSYFAPVSDSAAESEKGDYLKVNKIFSIWAADKWTASKGSKLGDDSYKIVCNSNSDVFINIYYQRIEGRNSVIDHDSKDAEQTAHKQYMTQLNLKYISCFNMAFQVPETTTKLKFSDGKYAYAQPVRFMKTMQDWLVGLPLLFQNKKYNVFAIAVVAENDWETYKDPFICMLGSFRALDDTDSEEKPKQGNDDKVEDDE